MTTHDLTDAEIKNIADCATDAVEAYVIQRDKCVVTPYTFTVNRAELHELLWKEIAEWFQIANEDHTAGMPEYENHRY